jgi:glycosyltransferase involved in cell wall biosynthesis
VRSGTPAQAPVLLVFSDDWGRHPSSCQHLIGHLLDDFQVIWVNTIGMRPPRLNWSTVTRGWEKIRGWSQPKTPEVELHQNLNITNPVMWPWMKRHHDRSINRRLLVRQLRQTLSSIDAPVIGITTIPIVADVMEDLPVDRWVYYCVDDFSCWPGLEQQSLGEMEEIVLQKADVVIAAGTHLQQRHSRTRENVHLLQHGINLQHWKKHGNDSSKLPLTSEQRPRITFWGLIDRRMDISFLEELSARVSEGSINLVGPQDNPQPQLRAMTNVKLHPAVSYDQLPVWAFQSDVLIMPYEDAPVTRAMQPLKLLEYLATELPVVARDLPANREWADCLDLAKEPEEFAELVLQRTKTGVPPQQLSARHRLTNESWQRKSKKFRAFVTQ